jgi:N-acetylneuraminic acid mutarotase
MSGGDAINQTGLYGTLGTAAPSNVPGGRHAAVSWLDAGGRFWLFGGEGYDSVGNYGYLNDLWEYDPDTLEWTWMSGSKTINQAGVYGTRGAADRLNVPGGRDRAVSWLDGAGRFWLFGGDGTDSTGAVGHLNDLWQYDPAAREWTWVSGSNTVDQPGLYGTQSTAAASNVPGARDSAVAWIDAGGQLWLFGGGGNDSAGSYGYLNDLWRYDPATLEWTWISGGNVCGRKGTYGTRGTAAASNVPGSRYGATSWLDANGDLWLFGGFGFDYLDGAQGYLNDIWKFDPATLEWTWIGGSSDRSQNGAYGVQGAAAASNIPGSRYGATSLVDASGNLWLFGGFGLGASGYDSYLNDLWKFDMATLEWAWVSGGSSINQSGVYGTRETAAASNVPGTRDSAVAWIDADGNFWLFGGVGLDSAGHPGFLNDLWRFAR